MRAAVSISRHAWLTVTGGSVLTTSRAFRCGPTSSRTPRGMAQLALRSSEDVVEELAEAYVNMDMDTMTAFQQKAMSYMLPGVQGATVSGQANFEEQLLQAMGGGRGGPLSTGVATSSSGMPTKTGGEDSVGTAERSAAASGSKRASEAKMVFDVTLKKFPPEIKIKLIKELRTVCGLAIQEAKTAIEKCPGVIARHVAKDEAEKLKAAMVKLGAEVELT